jgi:hypothetical protein
MEQPRPRFEEPFLSGRTRLPATMCKKRMTFRQRSVWALRIAAALINLTGRQLALSTKSLLREFPMRCTILVVAVFAVICLVVPVAADTVVVGFDGGSNEGFTGNFVFEATGGNPDGTARTVPTSSIFFPSLRTGGVGEPTNIAFVGDFSSFTSVSFAFDVRVDSITDFIGNQIARPFGVMLIDRDIQGPDGPSGVFFETPTLSASSQPDWTTYSVTINDPTSNDLTPGWIGFGDTDPNTFEPILPPGATFATVLASVDEFRLTGAVPGFFFNDAFFDMRIDNVSITTSIPEPSALGVILVTGLFVTGRRRKRSP